MEDNLVYAGFILLTVGAMLGLYLFFVRVQATQEQQQELVEAAAGQPVGIVLRQFARLAFG